MAIHVLYLKVRYINYFCREVLEIYEEIMLSEVSLKRKPVLTFILGKEMPGIK